MKAEWQKAIRQAKASPGSTVTILFTPGDYPMPMPGTYVYTDKEAPIHVSPPGIEVRFRVSPVTGEMNIVVAGHSDRFPRQRRSA